MYAMYEPRIYNSLFLIDDTDIIYAKVSPTIKRREGDSIEVIVSSVLTTNHKTIDVRIFVMNDGTDSPIFIDDLKAESIVILTGQDATDEAGVKTAVGDNVYNVTAQVYLNGEKGKGTTGTITKDSDIEIL